MEKNIDQQELAKFEQMAKDWWDLNGECRPLHELNPPRLQFITDRCLLKNQNVIDIGCGGGILAESMAKRGAFVTGIDATSAIIEIAKQHATENNLDDLNYVHTTAEEYAELYPNAFDVVTCMELLEHVPDPGSLIRAASRLTKPRGHLFFSTLNRTPKAYLLGILGAEYCLNLLPRGTHQYENFIRPSELDTWLQEAGSSLQALAGLSYNPFSHSAKITDDVSVNFLAHATKHA